MKVEQNNERMETNGTDDHLAIYLFLYDRRTCSTIGENKQNHYYFQLRCKIKLLKEHFSHIGRLGSDGRKYNIMIILT
jgi:hypothetical protein